MYVLSEMYQNNVELNHTEIWDFIPFIFSDIDFGSSDIYTHMVSLLHHSILCIVSCSEKIYIFLINDIFFLFIQTNLSVKCTDVHSFCKTQRSTDVRTSLLLVSDATGFDTGLSLERLPLCTLWPTVLPLSVQFSSPASLENSLTAMLLRDKVVLQ